MEPRPEDRKDAEIADGAGELGFFPPYSWWPLWCGAALAVIVYGMALGAWWLVIIGFGLGRAGAVRLGLRVLPRRARPLSRARRSGNFGRGSAVRLRETSPRAVDSRCGWGLGLHWGRASFTFTGSLMSVTRARVPMLVGALMAVSLVAAGCGTGDSAVRRRHRTASRTSCTPRTREARGARSRSVHTNVRTGATAVPVDRRVSVTADSGTLTAVDVSSKSGPVPGKLSADKKTWTAGTLLEPGTSYTVASQAADRRRQVGHAGPPASAPRR